MEQFALTTLNGVAMAALYFLVAAGFSLIFGVMRIVNMAHGSLFLLGGYLGWSVAALTHSWLLAIVAAGAATAALGLMLQQGLLRHYQGQELTEALITIAVSIVIADLLVATYGGLSYQIPAPVPLGHSIRIPGTALRYSSYSLALIGVALATGLALWLFLERTIWGVVLRAGIDDRQMVAVLGLNIQRIFALVFAIGAGLAGMAGVLDGTLLSLVPGVDSSYLVAALAAVIVGGMGSLEGSAVGALVVGMATEFGIGYFPSYAEALTFAVMAVVLVVRPTGLLGKAR